MDGDYPNECGICCGSLSRQHIYEILKHSVPEHIRAYLVNLLKTLDGEKKDNFDLVLGVKGKNATK